MGCTRFCEPFVQRHLQSLAEAFSTPCARRIVCFAVCVLTLQVVGVSLTQLRADSLECEVPAAIEDTFSEAQLIERLSVGSIFNLFQIIIIAPILVHVVLRAPMMQLGWMVLFIACAFMQVWTTTSFAQLLLTGRCQVIVVRQMKVLSKASMQDCGWRVLRRVFRLSFLWMCCGQLVLSSRRDNDGLQAVVTWGSVLCFSAFASYAMWQIARIRGVILYLAKQDTPYVGRKASGNSDVSERPRCQDHARIALTACNDAILGIALGPGFCVLRLGLFARARGLWPFTHGVNLVNMSNYIIYIGVPGFLFVVGNVLGVLALSGYLRGAAQKTEVVREQRRVGCRKAAVNAYQRDDDAQWQKKVETLAHRGISLKALLQFYRGLGKEYMLHFDGSRSTTADVVRQAVLPLTAETGKSYAETAMGGVPIKPNVFCTHNWANLFRDLVAAIISEATHDDTFEWSAEMLDTNIAKLEGLLEDLGVANRTYWICALSVAQHHAICGKVYEGDVDSVTGQKHPVCDCGREKYLNDTPPCRADGESINCEMNKFDSMMAYMTKKDRSFNQVIAVDRSCKVFTRAWVVAEVAQAHRSGLVQRLKLVSTTGLGEHEEFLKELRVEAMQASRPEDVEMILAKIPDKEAFNTHLQHLLFDELLAEWKTIDITQRLKLAGQMIRMPS